MHSGDVFGVLLIGAWHGPFDHIKRDIQSIYKAVLLARVTGQCPKTCQLTSV